MTTTVVNSVQNSKETILGMVFDVEQRFGTTPLNDTLSTLNAKFQVFNTRTPTNARYVKYFCWGNGGRVNDDSSLTSAAYILGTNMCLYNIMPFRAVPLESDLDAATRANYAMRVVENINGVNYACYYLKKLTVTQSTVQLVVTDPSTGVETAYTFNYSDLSPTVPTADSNGVITDVADEVSVILPATVAITGAEAVEAVSVKNGGDMRYAVVSELGFVTASTESVSVNDVNGVAFNYNEAILAQMVSQITMVGYSFTGTSDTWDKTINFSVRNMVTT